jgi:hypothetical protein
MDYIAPPPRNKNINLEKIKIQQNTIIIGDFNAASPKWGYNYYNEAGKIVEEYLNSNNVELVYKRTDTPTFLHYSGSTTNPDLALVSADLKDSTDKEVIEDPRSGHRPVTLNINLGRPKQI